MVVPRLCGEARLFFIVTRYQHSCHTSHSPASEHPLPEWRLRGPMPSEGHRSGHATKFSAYRATYLAQIERGSFREKLFSEPVTDDEAELAKEFAASQREKNV